MICFRASGLRAAARVDGGEKAFLASRTWTFDSRSMRLNASRKMLDAFVLDQVKRTLDARFNSFEAAAHKVARLRGMGAAMSLAEHARSGNSSCSRACHAVSGGRSRCCRSRAASAACVYIPGLRGTR